MTKIKIPSKIILDIEIETEVDDHMKMIQEKIRKVFDEENSNAENLKIQNQT